MDGTGAAVITMYLNIPEGKGGAGLHDAGAMRTALPKLIRPLKFKVHGLDFGRFVLSRMAWG